MKRYISVIVIMPVIFTFLFGGIHSLGHSYDKEHTYPGDIWVIASQARCGDQSTSSLVAGAGVVIATNNEDRGCCVLFTPAPKCIYTNRMYCTQKATEANIRFEFYINTSCKDLGQCR